MEALDNAAQSPTDPDEIWAPWSTPRFSSADFDGFTEQQIEEKKYVACM